MTLAFFIFLMTQLSVADAQGVGHFHGDRDMNKPSKHSTANEINGICTVEKSATNPFSGTCNNVLLILHDAKGAEVTRTRTAENGKFTFSELQDDSYRIVSGSKFYTVSQPNATIHRGANNIELILEQN